MALTSTSLVRPSTAFFPSKSLILPGEQKCPQTSSSLSTELDDNQTTNIFFSPFSISSAMAMVMLGARGNTAIQMSELEKQPTYETFVEWTHPDRMKNIEIDTYDLEEILTSMGMVDAFDVTKSNFSGMSETKDLMLSKVTHKAFVEVNEEGTEAAAVSGSYILAMCARLYPRFTAVHLFLFFIRHNSSMSILFAGRFCSP
uniref:Serpin peptidase inhibitor, clade B (ovalbumin), member 1, like 3 n=1 Tax=Amphiprion percula TaxID=161767 RepID=A0A3P8SDW3_AMPPE